MGSDFGSGSGVLRSGAGVVAGAGGGGGATYAGVKSEEELAHRERESADAAILAERDKRIAELEDMVEILSQKVSKLEQLVRLKDTRIGALSARIVRNSFFFPSTPFPQQACMPPLPPSPSTLAGERFSCLTCAHS